MHPCLIGLKTKLLRYNPIYRCQTLLMRRQLRRRDISILSSNCLGGLVYDRLGLQFLSPTINLRIPSDQFVRFALNYEDYFAKSLDFFDAGYPFPTAHLGDITIYFNHYSSSTEAAMCWNRRKERVNKDGLFVMLNDCDGITEEDLSLLDESHLDHIVVFTANQDFIKYRCTYYIPCPGKDGTIDNLMIKSWITGKMLVEQYFDFVKWFNQSKE